MSYKSVCFREAKVVFKFKRMVTIVNQTEEIIEEVTV